MGGSMKQCVVIVLLIVVPFCSLAQQQKFRSGIFLYQSPGRHIWGPNDSPTRVPAEITSYNNSHGLAGSAAYTLGSEHWPPTRDNEWARWHAIFSNAAPDVDIRLILAGNAIVMIKSCFPSSSMWGGAGAPADTMTPDDKSVSNYKWHWRSIVSAMRNAPHNFFVMWTNSPLVPDVTNDEEAAAADAFCRWAKDTLAAGRDTIAGSFPKNIYVFDYFHKLAGADGKLQMKYAADSTDSHPNSAATQVVAPQLVREMFEAASAYEQTAPPGVKRFPVVLLSSAALHAGDVKIGHSTDTAITIGNIGYDTLRITSVAATPDAFNAEASGNSIPPGGRLTVGIRFTPAAVGTTAGTILIASNASTSPDTVHVDGFGTGTPQLSVADTSMHFGDVMVGRFKDTTLTISNSGSDTLKITAIDAGSTMFSARPTAVDIPPGRSFEDTVSIKLDRFGRHTDSLFIHSNGGSKAIVLTGESPYPIMSVSVPSVYYGNVRKDSTVKKLIVVTNTSINALRIDSLRTLTRHFSAGPVPPPLFMTTNDTAKIPVSFTPDSVGFFTDTLFIYSNQQRVLETILLTGKANALTSAAGADDALPDKYELECNFPNPFNPATTFLYGLPANSRVKLQIFNVLGQLVEELVNGEETAGWHRRTWNAAAASGVYFYRLEAAGINAPGSRFVQVRKMMLVK